MQIVDANIILRYILNDHENLSLRARQIIDEQMVEIPIEVLCEVVFVLSSVYRIDRVIIGMTLIEFFENTSCELPHKNAVVKGLEIYSKNNFDFVDCILIGYSTEDEKEVYTFDEKLFKFLLKVKNNEN